MDDLHVAAVLARTPRLDAGKLRAACAQAGGPERLLELRAADLAAFGLHEESARAIATPDRAAIEADLEALSGVPVAALLATSPEYPELLGRIEDAPPALFVRGDPEVLSMPQLAMVGSRNPTAAGRATAREFALFFAGSGLTITSGLAAGIDAASHEGALAARGLTIAVCGTGLDRVYPPEHAELADRIVAGGGALVSEFPPRTPPLKGNFPQRNRIISGLALGVLVVEAARFSGSLSTAKHAGNQGRDIFAVPGSIHSALSRGCHKLIRDGAKLVEEAADVLAELKLPADFVTGSVKPQAPTREMTPASDGAPASDELDKEYKILLDALGFEPAGIDAIVERTGLPSESVASMLLILELEGRVEARAGGRYCGIPPKAQSARDR